MDIRHLEYFLQVAHHGGFNRASAHLHIAQSALSRCIRQLEEELGVTLFERNGRGVQITPAGELLSQRAGALLRQFRQTRDEIVAQSELPRGEIALGLPPSLQTSIAVPILEQFRKLHPNVFVTCWMSTSVELRELVLSGKVDLAVYGALEPETVLESRTVFRDPVYVVGPASANLGERKVMDMSEFAQLPLILTSRPNSMRLMVEHAATRRNLKLDVTMDVNSVELLLDLVEAGLGYSTLAYSALDQRVRAGRLSATRLANLTCHWIVANSRERYLSAAGRSLRQMLLDMAPGAVHAGAILPSPRAANSQ